MYIETENTDFIPRNFEICKFYGKDTCLAWEGNELVFFAFSEAISLSSTLPLNVLIAPGVIKKILNFGERVFVICTPCGIYKLTDKRQFALLSKSGIGMGALYSEVISLQEGCICLEGKHDKSLKPLFQVPSETVTSDELSSLKLTASGTDEKFRAVFLEEGKKDDLCLISYGKILYKYTQSGVKQVYCCDLLIEDILPVEKNGKIFGVALTTNSSAVIFMYLEENKLKFDKVYLNYEDRKVQAFCAKMDENCENCISMVYCLDSTTVQSIKKFKCNAIQTVRQEECNYVALRFYESKFVIGLTQFKEMCQFPLKEVKEEEPGDDPGYVEVKLNMLKGMEVIVEKICEKARELQALQERLEEERDILKRINLFAYDFREEYCPELCVRKVANQKYLSAKFQNVLPLNSQVVLAAKRGDRRTFVIKKVTNSETQIELPLPTQNLTKPVNVTVDLVTYNPKAEPLCLIKDFIQDPSTSKDKKTSLSPEKVNFLNVKIRALKNLIADGKITMKALSEIKSSVRRELE